MKKSATISVLLAAALALAAPALCDIFTFTPDPPDLDGLDHYYYYEWGIDVSALAGMNVVEIEVRIDGIRNWNEGENVLYIHIIDDLPIGPVGYYDAQGGGDAFAGRGVLVDAWSDTTGAAVAENIFYSFTAGAEFASASSFIADGVLGIGLDPDCHFYNTGISVVITAEEPLATKETSWGSVKSLFR